MFDQFSYNRQKPIRIIGIIHHEAAKRFGWIPTSVENDGENYTFFYRNNPYISKLPINKKNIRRK